MNRYEFRIWDDDLGALENDLAAQGGGTPTRVASDEIYLVSLSADDCTAKIRSDLLDIKVLLKVEREMEQWSPILKSAFPLAASAIVRLYDALKLEEPRLFKPGYTMDEFLTDAIANNIGIVVVKVHKQRSKFKLGGCETEFAAVTIDGIPRQTVAVESEDPAAVLALTGKLGIGANPNTGYVREIKRLLLG
jgi:exopolyphosphatase / guanosine-5'-triphosphate,3'-diphosphate pyrophosphatase